MDNTITPTGASTGELTQEEVRKLIDKYQQAKIVAVNEVDLDKAVLVDLMAVEVKLPDNERTQVPGTETKDALEPIVAGRKGENGAEIVYENGERVKPGAQEPNKSLKAAQERKDIEDSAREKLAQQKQDRE